MQPETTAVPEVDLREHFKYQKILLFMGIWVVAVAWVIGMILTAPSDMPLWENPNYSERAGYTKSLILVYLPWIFLLCWYYKTKDAYLEKIGKALFWNAIFIGGVWIVLDIFLANLLFRFPDPNAHLVTFWGYTWAGDCQTIWTIFSPDCYKRTIPVEEVLFYLGSAALLRLLYMWAAEDMFKAYSLPRDVYEREAHDALPLVQWNKRLIITALVILAVGVLVKKFWPHPYHEGWPYYLFAELVIVFLPLCALYNKVHKFTNPRAFLFVMVLQVLVSIVWEATLALPYGYWNYKLTAMVGLVAIPWSNLALEACFLWVSVAWGVMFMYELSKIKGLTGKSWYQVLRG